MLTMPVYESHGDAVSHASDEARTPCDAFELLEDELRANYERAGQEFRELLSPNQWLALIDSIGFPPDDPSFTVGVGHAIETMVIDLVDDWRDGNMPDLMQMRLVLAFFGINHETTIYDQSDYELVTARDALYSEKMDGLHKALHQQQPTTAPSMPAPIRTDHALVVSADAEDREDEILVDDEGDPDEEEDDPTRERQARIIH